METSPKQDLSDCVTIVKPEEVSIKTEPSGELKTSLTDLISGSTSKNGFIKLECKSNEIELTRTVNGAGECCNVVNETDVKVERTEQNNGTCNVGDMCSVSTGAEDAVNGVKAEQNCEEMKSESTSPSRDEEEKKCDVLETSILKNLLSKSTNEEFNEDVDNLHICDYCNKQFPYKSFLDRHRIIHTGQRSYICEKCNKTFTNSSNLNRHKLAHSEEKLFVCDICDKSFNYKTTLKEHKLTHSTEKLNCNVCDKSFSYKQSLIEHNLTHTGIKPYVCDICNKGFGRKKVLLTHKQSHLGDKPFFCEECNKTFSLKSNLTRHQRDFHKV